MGNLQFLVGKKGVKVLTVTKGHPKVAALVFESLNNPIILYPSSFTE